MLTRFRLVMHAWVDGVLVEYEHFFHTLEEAVDHFEHTLCHAFKIYDNELDGICVHSGGHSDDSTYA